jgi:hypothetical protein
VSGPRRSGTRLKDLALNPSVAASALPVLGIDPGGTTGVVLVSVPAVTMYGDPRAPYAGIEIHRYEQITGEEESQAAEILAIVREVAAGVSFKLPVVIEDFSLRIFSRSESLLSPVRMLGLIQTGMRAWDPENVEHQIFMQQPATAKRIVTDSRLERWGLYVPGMQHARDGLRHAVTLLRRCSESEQIRDLAWGRPE